ncbi:hypothetical protein HBI49_196790 [Parastagonospora nodorum]|nr:hypothetical protein HBH46_221430 [Parastagonospora nodorum]KAH4155423.1 hypothetical protein HBH43_212250 [Parastagonospora nodorum]KAH5348838.1 hypothetical protein HBI49_196790 [Parastagonospora nodorum]KAH5499407.1 hypothetical protein HBI29_160720 [Parastagonospora nodorum]KAH5686307.1 hypothetical protein HBI44_201370 [Parastagonospora nodorum]
MSIGMEKRQLLEPPVNDTQAPLLLGLGGTLLALCILLLCARFWSRRYNLRADDWAVLSGTFLATILYAIQCIAVHHGFGRRTAFVSSEDRSTTLFLIFVHQVVWYWAIALVKLSVTFLLLRLKSSFRWNIFFYGIAGLLIVTVITQTLFPFLQCRPYSVYWQPELAFSPGGVQCFPKEVINANIIAYSTIHVVTDVIFSLAPGAFIIRKLTRPKSEKVFLSILMGLGMFASTFAIVRTVGLSTFYSSGNDFFRGNVMPTLWANLELLVALIAATIPTLRSVVHRGLFRLAGFFYEEENETHVRNKLVAFGFLKEEEAYGSGGSCKSERKASKPDIEVGTIGSMGKAKRKDEFGETVVVEEKEIVMVVGTASKEDTKA